METLWKSQANQVLEVCLAVVPDVVGVYVHGSAALGGLTPHSDLDLLVVVENGADLTTLGSSVLQVEGPHALELSVVSVTAARQRTAPYPYLLHVASPHRIVHDDGSGDPDLLAHYAVTRQSGIALIGPTPEQVCGPVSPTALRDHLREELLWGVAHADQRYAVLNACRAVAYATDSMLRSKMEGAQWWLDMWGDNALVTSARDAQVRGENLGPASFEARAFVQRCHDVLVRSL